MRKYLHFAIVLLLLYSTTVQAQWTKISKNNYDIDLYDVYADGNDILSVGYAFSNFQGHIFRSNDGGATWDTTQMQPGLLLKSLAFKDKDTGYIGGYGNKAIMLQTNDGGQNWSWRFYDTSNGGINDMVFLDDKHGFASGYSHTQFFSGQVYRTWDGGKEWWFMEQHELGALDSVAVEYVDFLDPKVGFGRSDLFGGKHIVKTTDSGKSWQLAYTHSTSLSGMHFWNANTGILVDVANKIYKTTDAGSTWILQSTTLPTTNQILSIAFLNQSVGMMVGDQGVILKTTDGGVTWAKETSPTTQTLWRVRFYNNRAYATGGSSLILRSEPIPNGIYDMPFSEQLNVYPNPASDVLNISSYKGMYKELKASLTDMGGRTVANTASTHGMIQLNIQNLPSGNYILNVQAEDKAHVQKIIITH